MNKEEIDNLENYLKNELPKIELEIPVTAFGSVDLDDLMDSIRHLKKIPTSDELIKENKNLRYQLKEKDKVIDEILNDSWYTDECPIELEDFTKENEKEFNCDNCQDDYKKCWLKYFENKLKGEKK